MIIHISNQAAAIAKLTKDGFHQIANGAWVSGGDGTVKATIHPIASRETVQIAYQQIWTVGDDGRYGPVPVVA
jgi:hypothetical protein